MPNYTKLFNSIVTSTIWTEDDKTRIVWITILAMSDQNGEVHASVPGLARVAGVTLADCELALGKLLGPDPYSRTPDNEGRRIAPIDGGWELLNHRKYRAMASREDEKKANAVRQERFRARHAPVTDSNAPITPHNGHITGNVHIADTDSESDTDSEQNPLASASQKPRAPKKEKPDTPPDPRHSEFVAIFSEEYKTATGSAYAMTGPKDGMQLKQLLKRLPDLTEEQWRQGIKWCRDIASSDRHCRGFVRTTGNLAAFCSAWPEIVDYNASYTPPLPSRR